MLIKPHLLNEMADQAFAQSAAGSYSQHFNISIRAICGERNKSKQISLKIAIDKSCVSVFVYAIDMLTVVCMKCDAIIERINLHICSRSLLATQWFAGVRVRPRLHPWDEQELPFQTKAWLDVSADSGEQAQGVARILFAMGCEESPLHSISPTAKHVFVYSLSKESQN